MKKQEEPNQQVRDGADALKLALQELARDEPETLKALMIAMWEIASDGANKSLGRKLWTLIGTALLAAALSFVAWKGGK